MKVSAVRAAFANALVLSFAFAAIFATSLRAPYEADDFSNMESWYRPAPLAAGEAPTLKTFLHVPGCASNLAAAVKSHWLHETGRFQAAVWLRVFAGMPRWMFALVCASAWIALVLGIWRISGLPPPFIAPCTLVSAAFALNYDAGVWLSGTANYLFPAALTVWAVRFFACGFLGGPAFAPRNLWMVLLFPAGMFLAGGHELVSLAVCATLAAYWIARLAGGTLRLDGRLLLSAGYAAGCALVVFAPSTLSRAGGAAYFAPDGQLLYSAARKVMALARCCATNPLLVLAAAGSAAALCNPALRRRMGGARLLVLAFGWSMLAATCALCDGRSRQGWPMSVAATVMAASLFAFFRNECGFGARRWRRTCNAAGAAACAAGVAVLSLTSLSTMRRARAFDAAVAGWKADPYGVFVLDGMRAVPRFGWFDRSFGDVAVFGVGDPWQNAALARFHGRDALIGLTAECRDAIFRSGDGDHPLPHVAGWNELPGFDLLYSHSAVARTDCAAAPAKAGDAFVLDVEYCDVPPRLGTFARLKNRIFRKGWAEFSCKAPEDEMNLRIPLRGFAMDTPRGLCCVALHNRCIPRASIRSLVFAPDPK